MGGKKVQRRFFSGTWRIRMTARRTLRMALPIRSFHVPLCTPAFRLGQVARIHVSRPASDKTTTSLSNSPRPDSKPSTTPFSHPFNPARKAARRKSGDKNLKAARRDSGGKSLKAQRSDQRSDDAQISAALKRGVEGFLRDPASQRSRKLFDPSIKQPPKSVYIPEKFIHLTCKVPRPKGHYKSWDRKQLITQYEFSHKDEELRELELEMKLRQLKEIDWAIDSKIRQEYEMEKSRARKAERAKPEAVAARAAQNLRERKLRYEASMLGKTPWPDQKRPSPEECQLVHDILSKQLGPRERAKVIKAPTKAAGCGEATSVLEAVVRTILSQHTSGQNSAIQKLAMDKAYGRLDNWADIDAKGPHRLESALSQGGLARIKAGYIINLIREVKRRHGAYSLDHLYALTDEEVRQELLHYKGVGRKTVNCVLMFCLRRDNFAVDTHIYQLGRKLGWLPLRALRDESQAHLDVRVPNHLKYALHILMIDHRKKCSNCRRRKDGGLCDLMEVIKEAKRQGVVGTEDFPDVDEMEALERQLADEEEGEAKGALGSGSEQIKVEAEVDAELDSTKKEDAPSSESIKKEEDAKA